MTSNGTGSGRGWPTGHSGWLFDGVARFEGAATSFLAEGAARKERLMFVADDPDSNLWPQRLLQEGALLIASAIEIYGPDRTVIPASRCQTLASTLAEALRDEYEGLRVAADNSSVIAGPERVVAWMRWEELADIFMAENPVTSLCAFDRTRADNPSLARVRGAHRVTVT